MRSLLRKFFKILLLLPAAFVLLHTLVRIVRHFHKFPMPSFLANAIDNPLRRRFITPPDRTALRHGIRNGMTVLEVGPGNGRYTVAAARRVGSAGKVCAVDIEPEMIQRVVQRAAREGIINIDARVADVYALPFENELFDVIYMTAVIGEIPEPARALREFHRVLSKDGILVFSELIMDPDYPSPVRLERLAAETGFQLKRHLGNFIYYTLHFEKSAEPVIPPVSRVQRSHKAAAQGYDRLSRVYDYAASSEWPLIETGLQMLNVHPGQSVLEIGCGTGRALYWIADRTGQGGSVCGLDLSKGMLMQAKKRGCGSHGGALHLGNGLALPYPAQSFDRIFLSFTLETFDTPEIPRALAECRRVLKRDGQLGVVSLAGRGRDTLPVVIYAWFHRIFPVLVDCRPIYAGPMLQTAGFEIRKREERVSWGLPVDIILAQKTNSKMEA